MVSLSSFPYRSLCHDPGKGTSLHAALPKAATIWGKHGNQGGADNLLARPAMCLSVPSTYVQEGTPQGSTANMSRSRT